MKSLSQRDNCTFIFKTTLFKTFLSRKQPEQVPTDRWMDKERVVYIHATLWSYEREGNPAMWDVNEPWGHYAKWDSSVLAQLWNLKYKTGA